jgi:hypothetical protein
MSEKQQIAQLQKEVSEMKKQISKFMEFVGYEGKPYTNIIKANKVIINNHA